MRFNLHISLFGTLLLASTLPALASPHVRRGPTAPRAARVHGGRAHVATAAHLSMAPERATEIQTALIKAGYMTGTPSGQWDAPSQAAMEKLQADNGWQTKLVPDSRAIIKLGLGPGSTTTASTMGHDATAPQTSLTTNDTFASHLSNQ